jgi:hypothetical protein
MSRLVSAISLALALTAQVSTLVHMGAVRHEACAEHGELVETSATNHDVPVDGDAPSDASEEHDHCLLATTPSLSSTAPLIASVVTVVVVDDAVIEPPTRIVAATVLRSAPKTSPPLA